MCYLVLRVFAFVAGLMGIAYETFVCVFCKCVGVGCVLDLMLL